MQPWYLARESCWMAGKTPSELRHTAFILHPYHMEAAAHCRRNAACTDELQQMYSCTPLLCHHPFPLPLLVLPFSFASNLSRHGS